jgi:transposase
MGKLPDIEIAKMFGVTRQFVWITLSQSVDYHEQQYSEKEQIEKRNAEIRRLWQEGVTGPELVEMFGVSINTIYRAKNGVKHNVSVGCEKCKTEPFSRGYCRRCYKRWRKQMPDGYFEDAKRKREQRDTKVVFDYENGMRVLDITKKYDISESGVYLILKRARES